MMFGTSFTDDRTLAMPASNATETALLGGGCFWCLDAVFRELAGVVSIESGYAGGHVANPTYEDVCGGRTGHAEVVRVTFDPALLSYRDLLRVFFTIHDPTTRDRQGNDVGPQYRSVIFAQTPQQRADAEAVIAEIATQGLYAGPIVTELEGAATFYPAEGYHQDYATRHPNSPYIYAFDLPKIANLKTAMPQLYRDKPVLVSQAKG